MLLVIYKISLCYSEHEKNKSTYTTVCGFFNVYLCVHSFCVQMILRKHDPLFCLLLTKNKTGVDI